MAKNPYNLDIYYIIIILSILYNIYIIFKNQKRLYFITIIILIEYNSINYITFIS